MSDFPRAPRDRLPFSAIVDRPPLNLPDSARMVIWPIVNAQYWSISRPMPHSVMPAPMGANVIPDVPNWAWHEYGMRVGFWRLFECFQELGVRPTFSVNSMACEAYPRVCDAALEAGWEFMAHGQVQRPMHDLDSERMAIREAIEVIAEFTGKVPRGWKSPGLTETMETLDILAEEGIEYVADWTLDEQPCRLATTVGSIVSLPYTAEMSDVSVLAVANQSAEEWLARGRRQFERLYHDSAVSARIMTVSLHPYLSGVPHRIGYVEELLGMIDAYDDVVFWNGEQILDWYLENLTEI